MNINRLSNLISESRKLNETHQPVFLNLNEEEDVEQFQALIGEGHVSMVHDNFHDQLRELIKIQHPTVKLKDEDYTRLIESRLAGKDPMMDGVWVYYPWSKKLIHILDKKEFTEVRTNRNRYKITLAEQQSLEMRVIGIIGLSVGHSIALTIAMERICGELRLADFDTAELSNLNRLRTPLSNLGVNKSVVAAREIAEIDPFLQVKIFKMGLDKENMQDFFVGDQKLDILIEVCDGIDIKIQSRYKARELGIPVVMDTNDRGMLDVERFDLEPKRPVLHGLADGLDPETIKNLSNEEKVPYILRIIGADTISTRLKASMLEVEQSINTWPQLASSVTLGGALTTDVCRRILLNQYRESGRYYVDFEQLVGNDNGKYTEAKELENPHRPLERSVQAELIEKYFLDNAQGTYTLDDEQLQKIISAAIAAPSAGNNQPWSWVYSRDVLFLFHDQYRSWSWGDYYEMGAHIGLGAALENLRLQAQALKLRDQVAYFPGAEYGQLIAVIRFEPAGDSKNEQLISLSDQLFKRRTNRRVVPNGQIPSGFFQKAEKCLRLFPEVKLYHVEDRDNLIELSDIIAECDKVRLLNPLGHEEFYHELRWNRSEAEEKRDGVELEAVDIPASDVVGFKVAADWDAVSLLSEWDKGDAFKKMSHKAVRSAGSMLLVTIPELDHELLLEVGRAIERLWLLSTAEGISVHPMLSPVFFFNRLIHGQGSQLNNDTKQKLEILRERFTKIFPITKPGIPQAEIFLMKLAVSEDYGPRSLRRNQKEMFVRL